MAFWDTPTAWYYGMPPPHVLLGWISPLPTAWLGIAEKTNVTLMNLRPAHPTDRYIIVGCGGDGKRRPL